MEKIRIGWAVIPTTTSVICRLTLMPLQSKQSAAVLVTVDFYNNKRLNMSIGMLIPVMATNLFGDKCMKWRSYKYVAIKKKQYFQLPGGCRQNRRIILIKLWDGMRFQPD